ncbi:helix-turn-helix domain-containing protein [Actinokineospora sp.]|uniref:helix-turn-helix domain-containing protein n=1 Tax=Actinokineospora sp. TaxID=1872133 RepID=UPI0040379B1C
MVANSPTVLKRWIAFELRKLRETCGLSREDAAAAIQGSTQNVGHMELGRSLPGPLELERLLQLYGVPDRVPFWRELRLRAKKGKDWWIGFSESVPEYFNLFLGLESSAIQIESWDAHVIPGLFQTPDYARAIIRGGEPERPMDEVDRQVELRMARQHEVLDEGIQPLVWRVVAEPALRWQVGGAETMRAQLNHLVELSERPNIDIQVLPFSAGAHTGGEGTFDLLSFPPELENDPGVVYIDTRVKGYYYEDQEQIVRYRNALARLRVQAVKPADSPAFIHRIAKE